VDTCDTGFSSDALRFLKAREVQAEIAALFPDLVHVTGPHAWNVSLIWLLHQACIPVVHSLHDLDPHTGSPYGRLLYLWNQQILRHADHILVHGRCYRERLLTMGLRPERVTYAPLLFLFVGHSWLKHIEHLASEVHYEPWALFFGRLARYKGVGHLITASAMLDYMPDHCPRVILAGPGRLEGVWAGSLPPQVEVRNRLIEDEEAMDLFSRCGLLVLPYLDATQSALVAAAYFFRKPVVVSRTGALPEYVQEGQTGWLVEPDHPPSLARRLESALADLARLARMGAAARAWYDEQRAAELRVLKCLYERLVEERMK
jgi:glycosyltransferase involved in cell wall biosynthesis